MTGLARQATLQDVLARQILGLRNQCDAVLMTMGLMQQQPGETSSEPPSPPAVFRGGQEPDDVVERLRTVSRALQKDPTHAAPGRRKPGRKQSTSS